MIFQECANKTETNYYIIIKGVRPKALYLSQGAACCMGENWRASFDCNGSQIVWGWSSFSGRAFKFDTPQQAQKRIMFLRRRGDRDVHILRVYRGSSYVIPSNENPDGSRAKKRLRIAWCGWRLL